MRLHYQSWEESLLITDPNINMAEYLPAESMPAPATKQLDISLQQQEQYLLLPVEPEIPQSNLKWQVAPSVHIILKKKKNISPA